MGFSRRAAEIWRAFTTDGIPGSGAWEPDKGQIRQWGLEVEDMTFSAGTSGYSIDQFGAVADGTTDCTAFINAAIAAAVAAGRNTVVATPGVGAYVITSAISLPAGLTFDGRAAKFKQTTAGANGFVIAGNDVRILNVDLQGSPTNASAGVFTTATGIRVSGYHRFTVRGCTVWGWENNGIYAANGSDWTIDDNTFHSNRYVDPSSADVLIWSTTTQSGGRITRNRSYSNNSQGIWVSVSGLDGDLLIVGNHCITRSGATEALLSLPTLVRRHGIQCGYNAGPKRLIVAANIVRQNTSAGIYVQGTQVASPTIGAVSILDNLVADTGLGATGALSPAICLAIQGDGDVIANNRVEGAYGGDGATLASGAAISVQPASGPLAGGRSTRIANNSIAKSTGHGILIGYLAQNVTVDGGTIDDTALSAVYVYRSDTSIPLDHCEIKNLRIRMTVDTKPAIQLDYFAGTAGRVSVTGNYLRGLNNTTSNVANAGVAWGAQMAAFNVDVADNVIDTFRCGIAPQYYVNADHPGFRLSRNRLIGCHTGIAVGATLGTGRLISTDNLFSGCTVNIGGGPLGGAVRAWEGHRVGDKVVVPVTAAPTTGTWAVGDRAANSAPAVGQPKGWLCTVAGSPGTWVSEGNL